MEQLTDSAYRSCETCKKLKKKCDRKLPYCSRCHRVGSTCDYGPGISDRSVSQKLDAILSHLGQLDKKISGASSTTQTTNDTQVDTAELSVFPNSFPWMTNPKLLSPSYLNAIFTGSLFSVLKSADLSIDKVINTYFNTIHTWLPMIDPDVVLQQRQLDRDLKPRRACDSLLLLAMYLAVSSEITEVASSQTTAYLTCKQQFTTLLAMDEEHVTLQLIQSGLLVTVYEYGRGLLGKAYATLGVCSRLATLLELHKDEAHHMEDDSNELQDVGLRTWRALMILDCHVPGELYKSRFSISAFTPRQESMQKVPSAVLTWDSPRDAFFLWPHGGSCSHEPEFEQEYKASQLLQHVLSITQEQARASGPFSINNFIEVDHQLQNFLCELRMRHANKISLHTGGLASCVSAMLVLHYCNIEVAQDASDTRLSKVRIMECIDLVFDLAKVFQKESTSFLPSPVITTIFQTASILAELRRQDKLHLVAITDPHAQEVNEDLVRLLRRLSSRWEIASECLSKPLPICVDNNRKIRHGSIAT